MRILALEVENPEAAADAFGPLLKDEARKVWGFYQEDFVREVYFRADRSTAVLVLECGDVDEAKQRLSELPLVSAGLIDFDLIPLVPYPGFSRLFASQPQVLIVNASKRGSPALHQFLSDLRFK